MSVTFPNLNDTYFELLDLCVLLPSDQKPLVVSVEDFDCIYGDPGDPCHIRAFTNEFANGDFHLHVSLAKPSYFDGDPPDSDSTLDQVTDLIGRYVGLKSKGMLVKGHFEIPRDELPEDSIAFLFGGINTEVDGEEWNLVGARMTKPASDSLNRFEWEIAETSVTGKIYAELLRRDIGTDVLAKALEVVDRGVQKILFGTKRD